MTDRRSFHLAVHQDSGKPGRLRWSVNRVLWRPLTQARHAELGSGVLELDVTPDGATVHAMARELLRIALSEFERQLRDQGPTSAE